MLVRIDKRVTWTDQLKSMEVGQSILIDEEMRGYIASLISRQMKALSRSFVTAKQEDGLIKVERIA